MRPAWRAGVARRQTAPGRTGLQTRRWCSSKYRQAVGCRANPRPRRTDGAASAPTVHWYREESPAEFCRPGFVAAHFRQGLFQADFREACSNGRSQPPLAWGIPRYRRPQDIAGFLLHALAVPRRALLQAPLHVLIEAPNENLSHPATPPNTK